MKLTEVTNDMDFDWSDGERLPITKCKCGKTFEGWEFTIGIEDGEHSRSGKCPNCGCHFVWENIVRIYEIEDYKAPKCNICAHYDIEASHDIDEECPNFRRYIKEIPRTKREENKTKNNGQAYSAFSAPQDFGEE